MFRFAGCEVRHLQMHGAAVVARVDHAPPGVLAGAAGEHFLERAGLETFIGFVRKHKEIYRIIDEAEFVDPESFRLHYQTTAERIEKRLKAAAERGEVRADVSEVHAWAIMGMNVFLGLRYGVWSEDAEASAVADTVAEMLARGLGVR